MYCSNYHRMSPKNLPTPRELLSPANDHIGVQTIFTSRPGRMYRGRSTPGPLELVCGGYG